TTILCHALQSSSLAQRAHGLFGGARRLPICLPLSQHSKQLSWIKRAVSRCESLAAVPRETTLHVEITDPRVNGRLPCNHVRSPWSRVAAPRGCASTLARCLMRG